MSDVIGLGAEALSKMLRATGYLDEQQQMSLESFGYFLDEYVIEGANLELDKLNHRKFVITEAVISFHEALWRVSGDMMTVKGSGDDTYFVYFTIPSGYVVSDELPDDETSYMLLWTINTAQSGEITTVIDNRGQMGYLQLRSEIKGIITDMLIVDYEHITDDAVGTSKIQNYAVTTPKIADGAITEKKLQPNIIGTNLLKDGSVTHPKLAKDSVGKENIIDKSITTEKIVDYSITHEKIADGAVADDNIMDNTISNRKITNKSISHEKIADSAIWEENIADNQVSSPKIKGQISEVKLELDYHTAELRQLIKFFEGSTQDLEVIAARAGYPSLKARIDAMDPGIMPVTEAFIATEGQTVFNLTKGSYNMGAQRITLNVGGVVQYPGIHFEETSTTSVTLPEGVKKGTLVIAMWYEGSFYIAAAHGRSHRKGAGDELNVNDLAGVDDLKADFLKSVDYGNNYHRINVKEYGAKGDGKTDDTKAFNNAINYLYSIGGGTLEIPEGIFIVTGVALREQVDIIGRGANSIVKLKNGANSNVFYNKDDGYMLSTLSNFAIDGNRTNNLKGNGIYLIKLDYPPNANIHHNINTMETNVTFRDLVIYECADHGIFMDYREVDPNKYINVVGVQIFNLQIYHNGGHGIYAYRVSDCQFHAIISAGNDNCGFFLDGCASSHFVACKGFYNLDAFPKMPLGGWQIRGCGRLTLTACEAQEDRKHGFYIEGSSTIMMTNCIADSSGQGEDSTYYGYYIKDSGWVNLSNCLATSFHYPTWQYGGVAIEGGWAVRVALIAVNLIDNTGFKIIGSEEGGDWKVTVNGNQAYPPPESEIPYAMTLSERNHNSSATLGVYSSDGTLVQTNLDMEGNPTNDGYQFNIFPGVRNKSADGFVQMNIFDGHGELAHQISGPRHTLLGLLQGNTVSVGKLPPYGEKFNVDGSIMITKGNLLRMDADYMWIDSQGRLRISKGFRPADLDKDGVLVGDQGTVMPTPDVLDLKATTYSGTAKVRVMSPTAELTQVNIDSTGATDSIGHQVNFFPAANSDNGWTQVNIFSGKGQINHQFSGENVSALAKLPTSTMTIGTTTTNHDKLTVGGTIKVEGGFLKLGENWLWVDSQGRLRISKNSQPTDLENEGVVVGTQS